MQANQGSARRTTAHGLQTFCALHGSCDTERRTGLVWRELRALLRSVTASEAMYPRLIVATAADSSYAAFAFNWHASVKAAGVRHPMLFCLDDGLRAKLEPHGIITYAYPYAQLPVASAVRRYGTRDFALAARLKLLLQSAVLSAGFDLLFTDVDAPWAADLRPYLTRASAVAPYLVQLNFPLVNEHNSGVFYARSTPEVRRFFELVVATCSSEARKAELGNFGDDQRCSNFVLQCGDPLTGKVPGVECPVRRIGRTNACLQQAAQLRWKLNASQVADRRLKATRYFSTRCRTLRLDYGLLPPALFRTGGCAPPLISESCPATIATWAKTPPLLVHANWAVGEAQKRAKLVAANLWNHDSDPIGKEDDLTPARCGALLASDALSSMWGQPPAVRLPNRLRKGRYHETRRKGTEPACWEHEGPSFFERVRDGIDCGNTSWFDFVTRAGQEARGIRQPMPALIGFLDDCAKVCTAGDIRTHRSLQRGRATFVPEYKRLAMACESANYHILMLWRASSKPWNMCTNFKWLVCAAQGRLPNQRRNDLLLASEPPTLPRLRQDFANMTDAYSFSGDLVYHHEFLLLAYFCDNGDNLFSIGNLTGTFQCAFNRTQYDRLAQQLKSTSPGTRGAFVLEGS